MLALISWLSLLLPASLTRLGTTLRDYHASPGDENSDVPVLEGGEMRAVDLEVTDQLGFYRTMENVGTRTADFVQYTLQKDLDSTVLCVAGKGNNGGNAITTGRILLGRGFTDVRLLLASNTSDLKGIVNEQYSLFTNFGGQVTQREAALATPSLKGTIVLDGLLGTGITRPPRGPVAELIELVNSWNASVLSLDMPSGMDHVSGQPHEPCVRATWTLNYHVVKSGQMAPKARSHLGHLWTAETGLTTTRFGEKEFATRLQQLYAMSPIVQIF